MQHGGAHLLPLLEQHRDAMLTHGRLGKVGKTDALHLALTSTSSAFVKSSTMSLTVQPVAPPGTPYYEHALTAEALLKLRSYEPKPRQAAPLPVSKDGKELGDEEAVLAPEKPDIPVSRKPSELIWRMPHCYVRAIEPLAPVKQNVGDTGTGPSGADDEDMSTTTYGFVVTFFSRKPRRKERPTQSIQAICAKVPDAARHCPFELRAREYECSSATARDEWLMLYRGAVANYWHERLEATIIAAPEVYQFHAWAMDLGKGYRLVQVVLSTVAVYSVSRNAQNSWSTARVSPSTLPMAPCPAG
jgi:hypothetical protein